MSKDLEGALKKVLEIMEEHDLSPEELFVHIKEYEQIYEKLKGSKPRSISYSEGDGHKSLKWEKTNGSVGYKNLHGSHLKKDGDSPSKDRNVVFHINSEDGRRISFYGGGYSSSPKGNDMKNDIGIEIDEPINPNAYKIKDHKYIDRDIEKVERTLLERKNDKQKTKSKKNKEYER